MQIEMKLSKAEMQDMVSDYLGRRNLTVHFVQPQDVDTLVASGPDGRERNEWTIILNKDAVQ